MTTLFDDQYPNIAWWVADGRIEIGQDEYNNSLMRVLDQGGLVWESDEAYETIAEALPTPSATPTAAPTRRVRGG